MQQEDHLRLLLVHAERAAPTGERCLQCEEEGLGAGREIEIADLPSLRRLVIYRVVNAVPADVPTAIQQWIYLFRHPFFDSFVGRNAEQPGIGIRADEIDPYAIGAVAMHHASHPGELQGRAAADRSPEQLMSVRQQCGERVDASVRRTISGFAPDRASSRNASSRPSTWPSEGIRRESRVHVGIVTFRRSKSINCWGTEPSALASRISGPPVRVEMKAIRSPSGEIDGFTSIALPPEAIGETGGENAPVGVRSERQIGCLS